MGGDGQVVCRGDRVMWYVGLLAFPDSGGHVHMKRKGYTKIGPALLFPFLSALCFALAFLSCGFYSLQPGMFVCVCVCMSVCVFVFHYLYV